MARKRVRETLRRLEGICPGWRYEGQDGGTHLVFGHERGFRVRMAATPSDPRSDLNSFGRIRQRLRREGLVEWLTIFRL